MSQRTQTENAAVAVFGTWMIAGLFLDGWAHQAEKPETFFSPWHGILYSGFVAALIWFSWYNWRHRAAAKVGVQDRVVTIGLIVFIFGAVGDGLWHEIFGIEVDLEALVSPSHLALLIGGFLMVSLPLRLAVADPGYVPDRWRSWFPQGMTLTLCVALVLFFTQYLSPFNYIGASWHNLGNADTVEFHQVADLASVMVTNAILVGGMLWAIARWRTPLGACTLLFGASGLLLSGLEGFELAEVAVAFAVAGVVADLLVAAERSSLVVAAGTSLALWTGFFVMADWNYGIAWSPELWAGAIVLATASSALLSALLRPAARAVAAHDELRPTLLGEPVGH